MNNISTRPNQEKQIRFDRFTIAYNNIDSAQQTLTEIFNDYPYAFESKKDTPFIIDAGSNIGIAMLFFKSMYPTSKLLCFEPDPNAFQMLQINKANNQITDTTLVNAALSSKAGDIDFFGQIFVDSPDARGNSIINSWGLQRPISHTTTVKAVRLSSYIHSEVDFLKLDIEGAEQQVLEDLEKENKLALIHKMAIEVHQADLIKHVNDINIIMDILKRHQFNIDVIEKNTQDLLPEQIKDWAKKIRPSLFAINAVKL